ncbi:MAG TPA: ATP-binding protein [Bacteroidales bacterium]|nr:ATP-binding protein [Bacteroidales bacterium]
MIPRKLSETVLKFAGKYPVISVTGPRQSGKTTLVKSLFPKHKYISLENPETRSIALSDPKSLFDPKDQLMILDEIQYVPELLSYIQVISDETKIHGQFILTGSQSLILSEKISQTLAGRTAILKLLPFSLSEISKLKQVKDFSYEDFIFKGFYPRTYDEDISPEEFYPFYLETYVQRDVRVIRNVRDLNTFTNFVRLCAGRTGQLLDYSSLAKDIGVSVHTIKGWISILEAGFIVFQLYPYYKNFGKRMIKAPKLYFTDPGLAAFLLGIKNAEQVKTHYLKGSLFENLVVLELLKQRFNHGLPQDLWFFRDSNRNEVDVVAENEQLQWIEIKSTRTFSPDFLSAFRFLDKNPDTQIGNKTIIYGGDESFTHKEVKIQSWRDLGTINSFS